MRLRSPYFLTSKSEELTKTGTSDQSLGDMVVALEAVIKIESVRKVLEYIDAHSDSHVSVADMARVAGATQHHFVSVFTKAVGTSPHKYLLRKRIERAQLLLKEEQWTIAEISKLVGFRTHEHFSKVFRRFVGATPRQHRAENIGNRFVEVERLS